MGSSCYPSLKSAGLFLFAVWGVKSFIFYWFTEPHYVFEDFNQTVMAPFGIKEKDGPGEWFLENIIRPYFAEKQIVMRAHVLTAMVMAGCLFIQFTPSIRKKNISIHRISGRIFLVLFALMILPIFYLIWNQRLGYVITWVELPLVPVGAYFGIKGYFQAKAGDISGHRASMIMMSPTFFFFGVVRLMTLPYQAAVVYLGPVLGGPLGTNLATLGPKEYFTVMFGSSAIITVWVIYSVAVYNAYIVPAITARVKRTVKVAEAPKAKAA